MRTKTDYLAKIVKKGYYCAQLEHPFVDNIDKAARFSNKGDLKKNIAYYNKFFKRKIINSYEIIEVITHVTTHYIEKVNL